MPSQALLIPIFAVTYLFIAATRVPFLRIDRPAGALVGATALLATGLFTFIDWKVIAFLLGMMVTIDYALLRFLYRQALVPRALDAGDLALRHSTRCCARKRCSHSASRSLATSDSLRPSRT